MYSVNAPSRCTPSVSLNWQAFGRLRRQDAHLPQLVYGDIVTFTPAANVGFSLLPTTMVAATSWPGMRGKVTRGFLPRKEFRSLPQSPTMRTFSKRFSGETTGSGMTPTSASPGFFMMRAFILSGEYHIPTYGSP